MKRSEINEILIETQRFFSQSHFYLPPFAYFTPEKWQQVNTQDWHEVFYLKLGWDVTTFGSNDFSHQGLTLFTLRNGSADKIPYAKNYAEKIMHVRAGQVTPAHFHNVKREDIINRGGGNLIIKLWNRDANNKLANSTVQVAVDGCMQRHLSGSQLRLLPGESICLPPGLYHTFWGEPGLADVLVGEVSSVNDDQHDNHFLNRLDRYDHIEENVSAQRVLCNEYQQFTNKKGDLCL